MVRPRSASRVGVGLQRAVAVEAHKETAVRIEHLRQHEPKPLAAQRIAARGLASVAHIEPLSLGLVGELPSGLVDAQLPAQVQ